MSSFASFYSLRRNPVTGVIYLTIPSDEVVFGNGQTINEERIRIVGGMRLDTVAYLELADGSTVAVSGVNEGRVRYNAVTGLFECSENGGAYLPFGATGTGWTKTGTVVHLTVATDTVAIGSAVMVGTEKLYLAGDLRLRDGDSIIYENGGNDISLIWGTGPNVVIGNAFATNLTSNVSTQHTWNLSGLQYCALNATNMIIGPSNASYTVVLGQDSTNTAVRTVTLRGADTAMFGENLALRPGAGAGGTNGWAHLCNAAGTPGTTQTGFYVDAVGTSYAGGSGSWNMQYGSLNLSYKTFSVRSLVNGNLALAGDSITFGGDNTTSDIAIGTALIRGADHTYAAGAGSYGVNIAIRPGQGSATANNGWAHLCNAAGTPGTTEKGFYVDATGATVRFGSGAQWAVYVYQSEMRSMLPLTFRRTTLDDRALNGDNLNFGVDDTTSDIAISTGLIRGADHTYAAGAGSYGVNITIRSGKGSSVANDGIFTLQDAQANTLLSNNADGLIFSRANTRVPYTSNANPYDVDADKAQIIYKAAGGTINLRAAPTTGAQLHIVNATAGNITIGRNGKNINGAGADKTLGSYYHAFLLYDGTEWWYSSAPGA